MSIYHLSSIGRFEGAREHCPLTYFLPPCNKGILKKLKYYHFMFYNMPYIDSGGVPLRIKVGRHTYN